LIWAAAQQPVALVEFLHIHAKNLDYWACLCSLQSINIHFMNIYTVSTPKRNKLLGDMYGYLVENGYTGITYAGMDISPAMLEAARPSGGDGRYLYYADKAHFLGVCRASRTKLLKIAD
jgi:hypothetical protein